MEKPEVFGPALERAVGKELAKKAVDAVSPNSSLLTFYGGPLG